MDLLLVRLLNDLLLERVRHLLLMVYEVPGFEKKPGTWGREESGRVDNS